MKGLFTNQVPVLAEVSPGNVSRWMNERRMQTKKNTDERDNYNICTA